MYLHRRPAATVDCTMIHLRHKADLLVEMVASQLIPIAFGRQVVTVVGQLLSIAFDLTTLDPHRRNDQNIRGQTGEHRKERSLI
jgi:hypothetical protein